VNAYIEKHDLRIPESELDWSNDNQRKCHIYYNYIRDGLSHDWDSTGSAATIVDNLRSYEACEQLMGNMKNDLELLLKK